MKETWFLAPKELKSNGIRKKKFTSEIRESEESGSEESATCAQRKVR